MKLVVLLSLLFVHAVYSFSPATPVRFQTQTSMVSSANGAAPEVRFLGRGTNAVVRPGVVLLAPPDEYHHFLREAAVFIYAMGTDDHDVYVVRGVIIDQPTAFTVQEMMSIQTEGDHEVLQNLLYRGGEAGDVAFMLHSDEKLGKEAKQDMIGTSGIFEGGLEHVLSTRYKVNPRDSKFFFSYMEFTENEMEEMFANRDNESTQWCSVEVSPDFVLNSEWERGEAWSQLRKAVQNE